MTRPRETIFVLISDFYEGGNGAEMLGRAAALVGSGVQAANQRYSLEQWTWQAGIVRA